MKIAQLAPLWERVPPVGYGGTELVVYNLTLELARQGHEVTLFASGDSLITDRLGHLHPNIKLVNTTDLPLRKMGIDMSDRIGGSYECEMIAQLFLRADEFDIIHNHMSFDLLPLARLTDTPIVTTIHNGFNPTIQDFLARHAEMPFISISEAQQKNCPGLNYAANIYHGLEPQRFDARFDTPEEAYLLFLGRFAPGKAPDLAIEIAKQLGKKLIMAGKIDACDQAYYDKKVKPHLSDDVVYVGEVNHDEKVELFRNAYATLCPIRWAEPFGLVYIESLACGTPVLTMNNGSAPEVIMHGITGFVADTEDELVPLAKRLSEIDRKACRAEIEERFSVERMAHDHITTYQKIIDERLRPMPKRNITPIKTSRHKRFDFNVLPNKGFVDTVTKIR